MSPELAPKYFFDIFFNNFELIITIAIVLLIVTFSKRHGVRIAKRSKIIL
jgi:hypothetical protein